MKYLANENIPKLALSELQRRGFDIASASELMPGAPDEAIARRAVSEQRVIITFDKDYGYLVFKKKLATCGVILLRFPPISPEYVLVKLEDILSSAAIDFEKSFVVAEMNKLRVRRIR